MVKTLLKMPLFSPALILIPPGAVTVKGDE